MELRFTKLTIGDFEQMSSWFSDAELTRYIEVPNHGWLTYCLTDPAVTAVAVKCKDEVVGFVQIDQQEDDGHLSFYVQPKLRLRGLGKQILTKVIAEYAHQFARLLAHVEKDNLACQSCLARVGFHRRSAEADSDGFLRFEWNHEFASTERTLDDHKT